MAELSERYRFEDGVACIDIRVKSAQQLFDNRDPAPFHERDLDDDAREYIVGSVDELPAKVPMKIVLWFADLGALDGAMVTGAVRRHFVYERVRMARQVKRKFQLARWMLFVGLVVLGLFLTVAEMTAHWSNHPVGKVVREGFVIIGWVAMWRPLESILYEWWPLVRDRRQLERILGSGIEVRVEEPARVVAP